MTRPRFKSAPLGRKPDPVLIHLICAMALCDRATAIKAVEEGLDSLRPMTRARLAPVFERLGLPSEPTEEPRQ
jgi:hypothetical protein